MSIASIFKPKSDAERPAAAALQALRQRSAALQDEDAKWAEREVAAAKDVSAHDEAVARLHTFEERHLQAVADREVGLPNAVDPDLIEVRIAEERARAERLGTRRKIAERMLTSIRSERQRIRDAQISCTQQLPTALHEAIREHVRALAPEFLRAEQAYLKILAQVFGATRLADNIARAHQKVSGVQLGWLGELNVANIFTPRPDAGLESQAFHPVPMRDAIARAIEAEAAALEKAL